MALVEFAYNNYHSSVWMAPFETLYDKPFKSLSCWLEIGDKAMLGSDMIHEITEVVELIKLRMKATQDRKKATLMASVGL